MADAASLHLLSAASVANSDQTYQRCLMVASAAILISTTVVWRTWSAAIGARLVHMGVFPRGFARRRLQTALALSRIRRTANGEACLELEQCFGDQEISAVGDALRGIQGLLPLETLTMLNCASLSSDGLRHILDVVLKPKRGGLKVLYLRGCPGLGESALGIIGSLLLTPASSLTDLGVVACSVKSSGVSILSSALQGFHAEERAPYEFSATNIADLLANKPPLQAAPPPSLDAAEPLLDKGFSLESQALNLEVGLSTLQLSSNDLSGAGRSLAALIRGLPQLHWLSLEGCNLQVEDLQQLSRALPRSKLVRLDLADNTMRSKGLLAVISGLRASQIEDLGLERNEIGLGEALNELKAAHDRRPFPTLRLSGNRITARQESAFLQALRATPRKRGAQYCPPNCGCFYGRDHVM